MKTFSYPSEDLKIEISSGPTQGVLIELLPASEKQILGGAGKNTGDVVFVQGDGGTPHLLVSLGKVANVAAESFRAAGGALAVFLLKNNVTEASLEIDHLNTQNIPNAVQAFCEGLLLGAFRFHRYKSKEDNQAGVRVSLLASGDQTALDNTLAEVQKLASAVNLARDWAHEPANVINPVTLAARVTELAGEVGLKVTVIDDKALAEMGAGAITSVGKGSQTPARLIVLEYAGKDPQPGVQPVVLVGKALTFDTGGYSLKTTDGIVGMKYDKCGAMAVVGTLLAAAQLGLKNPLVGILGAAENMVSGVAYRPDDILTSMSGKTVEIISTDAEGRLVLADSLTYAQRNFKPRALIDLATLTGGVVVALGHIRAGLLSNNDDLAAALYQSGEATYERLWRLPLDKEYESQIKGDDGDIKNSGGRGASAIIGGIFLKEFVDDSTPWAHLDIAGTATTEKDMPYSQTGATGFGVRLLIDYLKNLETK